MSYVRIWVHCVWGTKRHYPFLNSEIRPLIKGEVSHWINGSEIILSKFDWADEYYAISVSDSESNKVRCYIANQEKLHQMQTGI